jgi:UDP-N-acetylglucosamine 2-epimerase (non-hydrolysing)
MLVFGTRPEAIKMAPLVKELQKRTSEFRTVVCVTAQHRVMLDQVLNVFNITPDYDLNIMRQGQDLYEITSEVLLKMKEVLDKDRPDVMLVHGDTTTSTIAALAAFYKQIPVGHVEAGLRTYNIYSPWPEEINRQLTARIATYHFASTNLARHHLEQEHVHGKIFVTGNTVVDALHLVTNRLACDQNLIGKVTDAITQAGYNVSRLYNCRKLVLITGHRRESFGRGMINILTAIKDLAIRYPQVDFVYPMHLNPNVRKPIVQMLGAREIEALDQHCLGEGWGEAHNMFFIEPLQYLEFVFLMEKSTLILTDSGGIQEEAPALGKPVLVMRDTTERPEVVEIGVARLVGTNHDLIVSEVSLLLDNDEVYNRMAQATNIYGDGHACHRIAEALKIEKESNIKFPNR